MTKIGLDIDGVLSHFTLGFFNWFNEPFKAPIKWEDEFIVNNFKKIVDVKEFWSNLPVLTPPDKISFEVSCYVTSRPISSHISYKWLLDNGFPNRPVFTVGIKQSKIEVINDLGITHFVDDHSVNMIDINKNTDCTCFLYQQPHNEWMNLEPGIKCLSELKQYL